MTEDEALGEIYGVDIMRDNVEYTRARLGGGTILHGDALDPRKELPGQTGLDHEMMLRLFC